MLNFGTVGSGWITDEYIKGAKDSGLWNLTAVYSRTPERGREYAEKHDARHVFTDLVEMAKSDAVDAVYVASPNYMHFSHCKVFLENGKHVICEKPISAQPEEVQQLVALAKENEVIFLEAIMFMHLPQKVLLEEALQKTGPLSLVKIDFCQRSSKLDAFLAGDTPNIFNPKLETGAFMDLGVYCVYPVLYLFGLPESFQADASFLHTGADAAGILTMHYPDKLVTLTYSKVGQAKAGTEFQGNDGTVYVDSISRLCGMSFIDKTGSKDSLFEEEEKYKLMGYEAKNFHAIITEPEKHADFYARCTELALQVSSFMKETREKLGIRFDSDAK